MPKREHFPVIDASDTIDKAAKTIARAKARGAVVRRPDSFALVGWRDVEETLTASKDRRLGDVVSVAIATPTLLGEIAHVDIGKLPHAWDRGALCPAPHYTCACGYDDYRPKSDCKHKPCLIEQI